MTTKVPAELSSTPSIVDNGNSQALTIDSDENIGFNTTGIAAGSTSSSQNSTATPKKIVINNDYSSGYTDASLKLYLFNSGTTRQGFTSGPAYDLQYHSSGHATGRHTFYVGNSEVASMKSTGLAFPNGLGINFSATSDASGVTSELLDDYEEGTWTPTLPNSTGVSIATYSANYTKIGRLVIAGCYIDVVLNSDSNIFQIGGLPYNAIGSNYYAGGTMGYGGGLNFSSFADPLVINGGSYLYFHKNTSSAYVLNSEIAAATDPRFIVQMTYMTA